MKLKSGQTDIAGFNDALLLAMGVPQETIDMTMEARIHLRPGRLPWVSLRRASVDVHGVAARAKGVWETWDVESIKRRDKDADGMV